MKRWAVASILLFLSIPVLVPARGGSETGASAQGSPGWPRWRGPNGDGISQETDWNPRALAGGPRVLWQANVGIGYSSVAVQRGHLYTMGCRIPETTVACLAADTGKVIWQYTFPSSNDSQATPTLDGTSVYALSFEGTVFCINAANGKLRWKKDLVTDFGTVRPFYGFAGSLVVDGELLLITANAAGMALKCKTGDLVWASERPPQEVTSFRSYASTGTDYQTPVLYEESGTRCALFSSWQGISSVDVATGRRRWLYAWQSYSGGQGGDPVVSGNRILLTFDTPGRRAEPESVLLEPRGGQATVIWKSPALSSEFSAPVIIDGYFYGGRGGPTYRTAALCCVELAGGRLMWEQDLGAGYTDASISLMAADGKLVVLTSGGMLSIAEATPQGYREISGCDVFAGEKKIRRFWTPPVLCDGRIYCRNYAGELLCIDVRP